MDEAGQTVYEWLQSRFTGTTLHGASLVNNPASISPTLSLLSLTSPLCAEHWSAKCLCQILPSLPQLQLLPFFISFQQAFKGDQVSAILKENLSSQTSFQLPQLRFLPCCLQPSLSKEPCAHTITSPPRSSSPLYPGLYPTFPLAHLPNTGPRPVPAPRPSPPGISAVMPAWPAPLSAPPARLHAAGPAGSPGSPLT